MDYEKSKQDVKDYGAHIEIDIDSFDENGLGNFKMLSEDGNGAAIHPGILNSILLSLCNNISLEGKLPIYYQAQAFHQALNLYENEALKAGFVKQIDMSDLPDEIAKFFAKEDDDHE